MLVNGQSTEFISIQDRGLLYGDGVFETILCQAGRPVLLAGHTQRLENGCKRLNLASPGLPVILSDIRQVAGDDDCIVKVILTRGTGARGYKYDPQADNCTRIAYRDDIANIPVDYYSQGIKLTQCETKLADNAPLAGIKHLNRLEQVLARNEWDNEYQEGVVLDINDNVIEGTMSNIFIETKQKWLTPKLDRCGVAGVLRQWILRNSFHADIECIEDDLTIADLQNAEAIFVCNSIIGIWPVASFAGKNYAISPAMRKIMRHLNENISKFYVV